jgi:hypothetical protein
MCCVVLDQIIELGGFKRTKNTKYRDKCKNGITEMHLHVKANIGVG